MAFCRVPWSTPWSPRPRVPLTCCPAVSPWLCLAWALSQPCSRWEASAGCWRRGGGDAVCGWPVASFWRWGWSRSAAASYRWRPAMACTISGISHDGNARCSVPPLPTAGRPAGFRAHGERRGLPVLLLWLLHRPSGEERQRRCVGGGVVPGTSRRGQLSVHEHHAIQSAGVLGGVQRCRPAGAADDSAATLGTGDAGGPHPRRTFPARDLVAGPARAIDLL